MIMGFRKLAALLIAVLLCLSIAACADDDKTDEPEFPATAAAVGETSPEVTEAPGAAQTTEPEPEPTETPAVTDEPVTTIDPAELVEDNVSFISERCDTLPTAAIFKGIEKLADGTLYLHVEFAAADKYDNSDSADNPYISGSDTDISVDLTLRTDLAAPAVRATAAITGYTRSYFMYSDPEQSDYNFDNTQDINVTFDAVADVNHAAVSFDGPGGQYIGVDFAALETQIRAFLINIGVPEEQIDAMFDQLDAALSQLESYGTVSIPEPDEETIAALEDLFASMWNNNHTTDVIDDETIVTTFVTTGAELSELLNSAISIIESSDFGRALADLINQTIGQMTNAEASLSEFGLISYGSDAAFSFDMLRELADELAFFEKVTVSVETVNGIVHIITFDITAEGETVTFIIDLGLTALDDWKIEVLVPDEDPVSLIWSIDENGSAYTHTFTMAADGYTQTAKLYWDTATGEFTISSGGATIFGGMIRISNSEVDAYFDLGGYIDDVDKLIISISVSDGGESIPDPDYLTPDQWDMNLITELLGKLGIDTETAASMFETSGAGL